MLDSSTILFRQRMSDATDRLNKMVGAAIAPLVRADDDHLNLVGTGTFICDAEKTYILTCKHVAAEKANVFGVQDMPDLFKIEGPFVQAEGNLDCAMAQTSALGWRGPSDETGPLELNKWFLENHNPTRGEVFFFQGYTQENSVSAFNVLDCHPTGFGAQINEKFASNDRFFYLNFDMSDTQFTPGTPEVTRQRTRKGMANGLSGALVWDTGLVRALNADRDWQPTDARVTGQLVNWDQSNHQLVARRIEDVANWIRSVSGS